MRKRSDPTESPEELREKIIGFGERSGRKSFYPELRERLFALRESERRLRAVFEGAAIGIAVIDGVGRLQATNLELQALLGQPAEALRGRSYLALVHAEDQERARQHHEKLLRGEVERSSLELRLARDDGEIAWAHVSTSLVAEDGGAPAYLVAAIQDITLRKRAQGALEFLSQASVRLASSLDIASILRSLTELAIPHLCDLCAIGACTGEGEREHRLVAGRDPAQKSQAEAFLAGRPLGALVGEAPPGAPPRLLPDASDTLLAAAAADPARLDLLRAMGLRSLMVIPLASRGRALGTLLLATAGSGRRYGQFDLELAMEFGHRAALAIENAFFLLKAQEASRLKDEFLAVVSHELRTPLTAILLWLELLGAKKLEPAILSRGLGVIERNSRTLAQIIDDLLGVSRMIAGKLDIHPEPMDVAPAVEAAVEALRPVADQAQVALDFQCETNVPAVLGDAKRLQQVVWNLVSNAVKYTPAGGRVEVRLARAGSSAEITVSDTGLGISPEFLPHVFEPFRQADSATSRRHGGLGLGLAIVQHLVDLHGGTVQAASRGEGQGARLTVTLPLASATLAAGPGGPDLALPRLEDVRILVVEDDPDTLELIGRILEGQGACVAATPSAKGALSELDHGLPDLLISDIAMPEQDGIALLEAVRGRGWRMPAIAISALAREEDRARALAAGFERYLVKPVTAGDLLRTVASSLSSPRTPTSRRSAAQRTGS